MGFRKGARLMTRRKFSPEFKNQGTPYLFRPALAARALYLQSPTETSLQLRHELRRAKRPARALVAIAVRPRKGDSVVHAHPCEMSAKHTADGARIARQMKRRLRPICGLIQGGLLEIVLALPGRGCCFSTRSRWRPRRMCPNVVILRREAPQNLAFCSSSPHKTGIPRALRTLRMTALPEPSKEQQRPAGGGFAQPE